VQPIFGLVECHTHLVYGGDRANEFAMRLAGATYEEILKKYYMGVAIEPLRW
jgi:imidazolonepropionase-like amidohydrolase